MGKVLLVARLAVRDLRRRPLQAVLLLMVISAAMAALTLGLSLQGVTSRPFDQTRAATAGPDVAVSTVGYTGRATAISAAAFGRFAALAHAPGVTAHSGPYPVAWPVLRAHGITANVMAEGRDPAPAAVDQPKVVQGTWVRGGGVVLERAFAGALGAHVGDRVTVDGRPFRVTGIAVTAAVPVYSQVCFYSGCSGPRGRHLAFDTGLAWLTEPAVRSLATPRNPLTYYLNLKLSDPAAARAFASEHEPSARPAGPPLTAWQDLGTAAATLVAQEQRVMQPASWLLVLLAAASVAVVAGARLAEQERRAGLLKAAGGTPALIAVVLLAEHLIVGVAAAAVGLVAGWLTAPLLTSPGASLVGSAGAPSLTPVTIAVVVAAAIAVAAVATLVPALRATRVSTVAALAALAEPARAPRRGTWLVKVSAGLPVPLLLGLRLVTRRPRRVLLSAASFLVTATALVAVMIFHATVGQDVTRSAAYAGPPDPGNARVSAVLLVFTVVMGVLAAGNAIFTTWATVLDTRRFSAIVRSLGATPRQTMAGLSVTQLLPALAGALIGIPAGTALYGVVQGSGPQGSPPAWWLLAMVAGMLLAVTALAAVPARLARGPVAGVLQSEAA